MAALLGLAVIITCMTAGEKVMLRSLLLTPRNHPLALYIMPGVEQYLALLEGLENIS